MAPRSLDPLFAVMFALAFGVLLYIGAALAPLPNDERVPLVPLSMPYASGDPTASGTAPPPYNDTNTPINQGLGGIGRSQGWSVVGASGDLFDDSEIAAIGAAFKADVEAPSTSSFMRKIVITRTYDSAGAGKPACVRLGPETNTPTLSCPDVGNEDQTGGCYLLATGDSCSFLWRPIKDCTTWNTCRPIFWYDMNGAGVVGLSVSITW